MSDRQVADDLGQAVAEVLLKHGQMATRWIPAAAGGRIVTRRAVAYAGTAKPIGHMWPAPQEAS